MELPPCSPRQYNNYMPPPPHYTSFHQIERGPPGSSSFESSIHGDRQAPRPIYNGAPPFDSSYHYYHWQMPRVEYITDIQPNDGK